MEEVTLGTSRNKMKTVTVVLINQQLVVYELHQAVIWSNRITFQVKP
jgi:hypothetical protein